MPSHRSAPRRFWTPGRIRRVSSAVIFALVLSFFIGWVRDHEGLSVLKAGDFPAFYSAAVIVERGQAERLYDAAHQRNLQNEFWPALDGKYYPFVYPPFVAVMLSPLAFLPPLAAKIVFTLVMIFLLILSVRFAAHDIPLLRKNLTASAAFFLAFFPVSMGVLGGQMVAASMFLYAACLRMWGRGDKRGEYLAGICLGLWFFKPHYGLTALACFLAAGYWRVLAGAMGTAAGLYSMGAAIQGPGWIFSWTEGVQVYAAYDALVSQRNMISISGMMNSLMGMLPVKDVQPAAAVFFFFLTLGVFLAAMKRFLSLRKIADSNEKRAQMEKLFYLAGPLMVLIAPHALYYDLGLCVFPCARFLRLETDREIHGLVLVTAAAFLMTSFRFIFPMNVFALYAAAVYFFVLKKSK